MRLPRRRRDLRGNLSTGSRARPELHVLVSCEHGGNRVPASYRALFAGADAVLASHRGWDPGALPVARALSRALGAPLHEARTTRLLVDLNRSAGHPRVFSEYTRGLDPARRSLLLERWHTPYRAAVAEAVARGVAAGVVVHLSVHSFTPVLDGVTRRADVSLLYDPRRGPERALAAAWSAELRHEGGPLRMRRNHPYLGRSDGLTTWLRGRTPEARYLGIEIELNQGLLDGRGRFPDTLAPLLVRTFHLACRGPASRSIFTA